MTKPKAPQLFCFGLGFSAMRLVAELRGADWIFGGTVRDARKAQKLALDGIDAAVWDGGPLTTEIADKVAQATHILVSVPPDADGDPVLRHAAADIAKMSDLRWLGYLSTTGVYGNTDGAVVDETAPLNPSSARSQRRVDAEAGWSKLGTAAGQPAHIFRLAGIYGPGRSVLDTIRRGGAKRIDKPGHAFSRIHVDDIGQILAASIARPAPGTVYNVCDDLPAPPADVTAYACELLGVEPPPLESFDVVRPHMSPMALSFWDDNRRVDNHRISAKLGVRLRYPDYRAGLQAILAQGG